MTRKQMLDIGEHQLLMLLLVLQAQCDELSNSLLRRRAFLFHDGHQRQHLLIHHSAIGHDLRQSRSGQQAPLGSGMACTHLLVIGVEQHAKTAVKSLMPWLVHGQYKGFEEPAGMGQMPFGRTGVRHGLHAGVFCRQGRSQLLRAGPHPLVLLRQHYPVPGSRRHGFRHGHE
ncbi:hypothetical protein SDC9_151258 [bioreactor metagenome]|uniref:Uncharacterized protein n=1 Tax=bioreactor metagenome TaxID=1076179 RepID=A0A645ERW1_9ZZZZ